MSEVETRLDRLEAIAESTLLAIRELSTQQQAQQVMILGQQALMREQHALILAESENVVNLITGLAENMETFRQSSERHWQVTQEMQSEVRGLQTENRRILERLEGDNA